MIFPSWSELARQGMGRGFFPILLLCHIFLNRTGGKGSVTLQNFGDATLFIVFCTEETFVKEDFSDKITQLLVKTRFCFFFKHDCAF